MTTPEYFRADTTKQERWLVSYVDVITILLVLFVTAAAHGIQKMPAVAPQPKPPDRLAATKKILKRARIDFEMGKRGLVISLPQAVLYATGDDEISSSALPLIASIAQALAAIPDKVILVGHADASPIQGGRFRTNWELSAARSLRLLELLTAHYGVPEARLSIAGDGPYSPIGSNETADGRAANRRVDILILDEGVPGV